MKINGEVETLDINKKKTMSTIKLPHEGINYIGFYTLGYTSLDVPFFSKYRIALLSIVLKRVN